MLTQHWIDSQTNHYLCGFQTARDVSLLAGRGFPVYTHAHCEHHLRCEWNSSFTSSHRELGTRHCHYRSSSFPPSPFTSSPPHTWYTHTSPSTAYHLPTTPSPFTGTPTPATAFLAPRDRPAAPFPLSTTLSCQLSPFEDQPHVISLTRHKDTQQTRQELSGAESGPTGERFGWH